MQFRLILAGIWCLEKKRGNHRSDEWTLIDTKDGYDVVS